MAFLGPFAGDPMVLTPRGFLGFSLADLDEFSYDPDWVASPLRPQAYWVDGETLRARFGFLLRGLIGGDLYLQGEHLVAKQEHAAYLVSLGAILVERTCSVSDQFVGALCGALRVLPTAHVALGVALNNEGHCAHQHEIIAYYQASNSLGLEVEASGYLSLAELSLPEANPQYVKTFDPTPLRNYGSQKAWSSLTFTDGGMSLNDTSLPAQGNLSGASCRVHTEDLLEALQLPGPISIYPSTDGRALYFVDAQSAQAVILGISP
jgi:hypothetical protein